MIPQTPKMEQMAAKTAQKTAESVRLKDGRLLGYAEGGDPDGVPVLYFHGFPGSRLEATLFPVPGIRLIGIDRPGYGLSTPKSGRRLADWADDIAEFADRMRLSRFGVIGLSGGAPYGAMVAHALSDRVNALALVCGLGPPEAPGMTAGRLKLLASIGQSRIARFGLSHLARRLIHSDPAVLRLKRFRDRMPRAGADIDLMRNGLENAMLHNWREGLSRSHLGMSTDARIYGEDWPFDPSMIAVPATIWHGRSDTIVPVSIGEYYARAMPEAEAHFPELDGHFSVVVNGLDRIAAFLAEKAEGAA